MASKGTPGAAYRCLICGNEPLWSVTRRGDAAVTWADPEHLSAVCKRPRRARTMASDCVFCRIVAGDEEAWIVREWIDAVAFRPLNPVTEGHLLVVPRVHVENALVDPLVTAVVMHRAAALAREPIPWECNLITSTGTLASQTIEHLHVHMVPRRPGDGLLLPWSEQDSAGLQEQVRELTDERDRLRGLIKVSRGVAEAASLIRETPEVTP